jgi:hypothetical protein
MSNGNVFDGDRSLNAEVLEVGSGEGQTQVGYYAIWEAKVVNYLVEQLSCFFWLWHAPRVCSRST